jgi:hypothetical protein
MKTCTTCGIGKPLDCFESVSKWKRGQCKECRKAYFAKWETESKDLIRHGKQRYYQKNKEAIKNKVSAWVKENPIKRRKNALSYYYRLQDQAIKAYGGYKCSCCGESNPMFLCLDHIANNGKEHRKEIGSTGGHKLYKWLKNHNYPEGFQVLCMNCNHGKYRNGGVCPHQA